MEQPPNREKAIFLKAIEKKTPQERSAFLDEACGDDSALRQRVEELLESADDAGSFLDGHAVEQAGDGEALGMDITTAVSEGPGTSIGPYRVMEQIGEGGFGLVFVAEQQEPVRRRVALKVIKPGMDSRDVIARFEAERQALALMDHPNIARVLDAGTTDSGRPFFVMDLVRGIPITEFCDRNQLSPNERLELFVPVCRAIQHAHQKGIIHRDVKPSNVLVTLHDGEPVVKVIDFGVAKALNQELTQRTVYTKFAQMIGTPLYMSPEQAEMSGLDVDTRSDIYSLGVLLYELLTGSTPIDRKRLSEAAFDEIRRIIREEEPPKPSTRLSKSGDRLPSLAAQRKMEPAKLSRSIRGELDWIVMKALEKDRNRRYETANGFAADILRYLSDDTVMACPPTAGYRLRKFARRNRTLLGTTAIVALALIAGTVVSTWQAIRARKAETRSNRSADEARENADRATQEAAHALESQNRLVASERQLRDRVYASDMNVISAAYADGAIDRMNDMLEIHRPLTPEEDQRGFEWYHWWRAGHLERRKARHPRAGPFSRMAVSPDGRTIAVTGWPRHLFLYDGQTLCLRRAPLQIDTPICRLCFSPDSRFLAVGGRILDTKSGETVATAPVERSAAAFAAEKPLLATGYWNIQLWKRTGTSWEPSDEWETPGKVEDLKITPDGRFLVAQVFSDPALNQRIEIWDVRERKVIRTLDSEDPQAIRVIAMSPDGNDLAVGEKDGDVHLWDSASFAADGPPLPRRTLSAPAAIASLDFSADGKRLVAGMAEKNNMLIWELDDQGGESPVSVHAHSRAVSDVRFGKDANHVYSAGDDGYLKAWDLARCQPYDTLRGVDPDSHIGFADDNTLVYHDRQGIIQRWDVRERELRTPLDRQSKYDRIAISDDGGFLAGVTVNGELRVWDLADRRPIHTTSVDAKRDSRLEVSRNGRRVAYTVKGDLEHGSVSLIDFDNPSTTRDLPLGGRVTFDSRQAFAPDGKHLVVQRSEQTRYSSHLLDLTSDPIEQRYQLEGWGPENCAAFSWDGATLAIGSYNFDIRLHDAATGELKHTLRGHSDRPRCLAFTKDGSRLISAGYDGTVRIWMIGENECRLLSTLHGHSKHIEFVAVSPAGTSVAAVHDDGTLLVWRTATQREVQQSVDRQLTRAQDLGPTEDAFVELDEAHKRDPHNPQVLALRGRLHHAKGDWNAAIADFTGALDRVPDNEYLLQLRAEARAGAGQWVESLDDWNRLVQLTDGRNADYLCRRGECYLSLGRRTDARADFVRALRWGSSARSRATTLLRRIESSLLVAEAIVPNGAAWRYSTVPPPEGLHTQAADYAHWKVGAGPFGTGMSVRTFWSSPDIWLQKTFELDREIEVPLVLRVLADDHAEIYLNGALAASVRSTQNYTTVECSQRAHLRRGENSIAVHCHDAGWDAAGVDVGLYVRGDPTALEKVLPAALEQAPEKANLQFAAAEQFVRQRQWEDAAARYGKLVELNPADSLITLRAAILYAYNEDLDRFHQLSSEALERFAETDVAYVAERVAKACLVAPPQEAHLPVVGKLADKALTLDPSDRNFIPWAQLAKALAEYRGGNPQAAIQWAEKCIANSAEVSFRHALCLGVLALAHHQRGDGDAARKAETDLVAILQEHSPLRTGAEPGGYWHEWLACEVLLREFHQALAGANSGDAHSAE